MAELHSCYPSSPFDTRKKERKQASDKLVNIEYKGKGMKSRRARRLLFLRPLPAGSYSSARCPPALPPPSILGGNFPTLVAARKSITALSHFSTESSSETCTCRHLPALHPVAFPTSFQSVFCWSLHRLQWRKRCSRVGATVLPPPPRFWKLCNSN